MSTLSPSLQNLVHSGIAIGEVQDLYVVRLSEHGAYLGVASHKNFKPLQKKDECSVLLPRKFLPTDIKIGDCMRVFVMHDSNDRPIAFGGMPKAQRGDIAELEIVEILSFGCFLDIGMDKHIFMPSKNALRFYVGQKVVVYLTLDKQLRLIAKLGIKAYLKPSPYFNTYTLLHAQIFESTPLGFGCVVEGKYYGLLYANEIPFVPSIGERLQVYVKKCRKDGKLDLLFYAPYSQNHKQQILDSLPLALDFQSSPEAIFRSLKMSKKLFKRAINELVREGEICYDSALRVFQRVNPF